MIQISIIYYSLDFSFYRFSWTQESIRIPIYRYNYQACQYDGGPVTNFPTNQYPEIKEWVNLADYQHLVCIRMIEKKWPVVFYPIDKDGRFTTQVSSNDINAGAYYQNPLSSSLETDFAPETKSKQ